MLASGPPPEFMFVIILVFALLNFAIMAGFGTGGYFIAKKYKQPLWLGVLLGVLLGWIGLLIIFLVGRSQQQQREREEYEARYAQWWHANYGRPQDEADQTPYGVPGQYAPPPPPPGPS